MDRTYTVKFEHKEQFTQVEFSKVYASTIKEAQDHASEHFAYPAEWVCVSVERND